MTKARSPSQTNISVSLPKELLAKVKARAKSLGITRSAYLVHLMRNDLREPGSFTIYPDEGEDKEKETDFKFAESFHLKKTKPRPPFTQKETP